MIKAVVFDLDGVIVNAVEWHYQALHRALSLFGYQISPEEHRASYNGLPTKVKLEMLTQRKNLSPALHDFIAEMKQNYTKQIIHSSCSPDVKLSGLLRYLKEKGFKIACASNSIRETVDLVLEKMSIRQYFDVIKSNQDVTNAKPHPEIYLETFKALELEASECLVIEDSIPGIQAARAATSNVLIVANPDEVTHERVSGAIKMANKHTARQQCMDHADPTDAIEIIIPMAGLGQRFAAQGFEKPKPLIDVFGIPMIQWVIENMTPKNRRAHFTFICNKTHLENYDLESMLRRLAPGCTIIEVPGVTEGAACTVLLAKECMDRRPLLIANSDQWVDISIDDFLQRADADTCDGLIMTFAAHDRKWSYARVDSSGQVTQVAEKNPISKNATVGVYYFREGRYFAEAAENMIQRDIRTNGEFYVCPVYNVLIEMNKRIKIYEIPPQSMHGMGTPEDLDAFQNQENLGLPFPDLQLTTV